MFPFCDFSRKKDEEINRGILFTWLPNLSAEKENKNTIMNLLYIYFIDDYSSLDSNNRVISFSNQIYKILVTKTWATAYWTSYSTDFQTNTSNV